MTGLARHLVAIALALLLPSVFPAVAIGLQPGDAAPEFTIPDIDGRNVTLSEYRGKTVLIAFWSVWCSRCAEELVFLRDKFVGEDSVEVLLVNLDSERTLTMRRIVETREALSLPFRILPDSELELSYRFGVKALPMNIVIGRDGRVLHAEPNFYRGSREKLFNAVFPDEPCLRCNAPLIQYLSH
jgi:peroxiredoxin